MDIQAKRIELAKWILDLNEDILSKVEDIKERTLSDIVAYTAQGEPLTKQAYIKRIKDAEARIKAGEYTTHEDLLEEMKSW